MDFIIYTGKSRRDKHWKEKVVTWDEFIERLSRTTYTKETQEEYLKMKKEEKTNAKDVGGYVAGKLKEGSRKNQNVVSRTMLYLDTDHVKSPSTLENAIKTSYDFACFIHSTHSHRPENTRLRTVVPLSRPVSPDEYQAIIRMVAFEIGMEFFDDSSYKPSQLMYWPSTPSNGEFVFKEIKGPFLDPDAILAKYHDWRDASSWPRSSGENDTAQRKKKKQQDPLEKTGLVGAFCRSYGITKAIETFLPDVYEPSAVLDRYDYIPADSSAGVEVHDDRFSYSHHATDPACGMLLNSFDLVRVHKFLYLDEYVKEGASSIRLPSYKAMLEFAKEDKNVKLQLAEERRRQIEEDFSEMEEDDSWQIKLEVNKNGGVKDTLSNITEILRHDELFTSIAYNELSHRLDVKGKLPWRQVKEGWNDSDLSHAKVVLDKKYGIYSPAKFKDALIATASERTFHPVKDYFDSLPVWDETKRVDRLLIDYFGAEDNSYIRGVMRKTLVAAVARVYEPGIKFDNVLILVGEQGLGKSTFFSKLAMNWFSDSLTLTDMRDKSSAEKLQGYWLLELGELAGLRKMDLELVKAFITRRDDKFRHSYGVYVESHPRQCIIVGTTNSEKGILRDVTGNRRYWPVTVRKGEKSLWDHLTQDKVDQVWAEALLFYRQGEKLILEGEAAELAYRYQQEAMEEDDREGLVNDYLDKLLPENWKDMGMHERRMYLAGETEFSSEPVKGARERTRVCFQEIWCECFGKDKSDLKRGISFELQGILVKIGGWKRYDGNKSGKMKHPIYGVQVTYVRDQK